jgi:hypothetical protein
MSKAPQERFGDTVQVWLFLGYRLEQLIVNEHGARLDPRSLNEVLSRVQNPHGADLAAPAIREEIERRIAGGYMPHHLVVNQRGAVLYDRELETSDLDRFATRPAALRGP